MHRRTIALFPGEMKQGGQHVDASWYHDVPVDEPEFVEACLQSDLREKVRGLLRKDAKPAQLSASSNTERAV